MGTRGTLPKRSLSLGQSSSTVAIATCATVAGVEKDDLKVIEALRKRGVEAVHAAWDDPRVDWPSFALVVIRSTWDYPQRHAEFLAWANRLPRVLNPLPILRWNTDKRYLDDLAGAGISVVPTRFLEPGDGFEPPSSPFVVKPAVSCSAKDTARYHADDKTQARDHVRRLQASGRTVMVQPYCSDIEGKGEIAILFIGGAYSHSICRDAVLKHPGLSGVAIPENVRAYQPKPTELSLAERVMSHIPGGSSSLLYGRVDLIPGLNGEPMVLEVELTEPTLFLEFSKGGVERLADCIASALAIHAS
jgi:glutathione synthase/RimK-type ligase-like ATP-grasp enzyme